jgi:hypothetical protein
MPTQKNSTPKQPRNIMRFLVKNPFPINAHSNKQKKLLSAVEVRIDWSQRLFFVWSTERTRAQQKPT